MNNLRSVLRDVAGPERVHAADIVFELCENQWLSMLPELKRNTGGSRRHNLYSKSAGSRDVTAQNLLRQHERLDAG